MVTIAPRFSTARIAQLQDLQFTVFIKPFGRWAFLNAPLNAATNVAPWMAGAAGLFMNVLFVYHTVDMSPATNVGVTATVAIIGGKRRIKNEHNLGTGCEPG